MEKVYNVARKIIGLDVERRSKEIEALSSSADRDSVLVLIELAMSGDNSITEEVLEQLSTEHGNFGRCIARAFIHEKDECVRNAATEALGRFALSEDIDYLEERLNDESWLVRASAASSLSCIATSDMQAKLLLRFSKEPEPTVRRYIAVSLADAFGENARSILYQLMEQETSDLTNIRIYIGIILSGDITVIDKFLALLWTDESVAMVAASCASDLLDTAVDEKVRTELIRVAELHPSDLVKANARFALDLQNE